MGFVVVSDYLERTLRITYDHCHLIGTVDEDWAFGMLDGGFDGSRRTTASSVSSVVIVEAV